MLNRYSIRNSLPNILTLLAYGGVIATGITSARAAIKWKEKVDNEPCDAVKEAVKSAIVPTAIAGGTCLAFSLARRADKKAIAALSASTAMLSSQLIALENEMQQNLPDEKFEEIREKVDYKYMTPYEDTVIIDDSEDAIIYMEPYTGLTFLAKRDTVQNAFYNLNRNFQLRGGLASLYELFRLLGIKKKDIKRLGLEWTEYIGWGMYMINDGYCWIDYIADESLKPTRDEYISLAYAYPLMPICEDPPQIVFDKTHTDMSDTEDIGFVKEDMQMIKDDIRDKEVE